MKKAIVALMTAGMLMTAAPAFADAAGQPSENANCLGEERATRNSNGGDREHGAFGPLQAEAVKANQPYGQFLKEWKATSPKCTD